MRKRWRRGGTLEFESGGVVRKLSPGDKLHLTQSLDAEADGKRSKASVTVVYEWDGRRLKAT